MILGLKDISLWVTVSLALNNRVRPRLYLIRAFGKAKGPAAILDAAFAQRAAPRHHQDVFTVLVLAQIAPDQFSEGRAILSHALALDVGARSEAPVLRSRVRVLLESWWCGEVRRIPANMAHGFSSEQRTTWEYFEVNRLLSNVP